MDSINHLILLGAALVVLSILVGTLSSRIGAPLLLIFLGLGMLAGEDGPGGVVFSDFRATYLVGSVALAIILFDGGLRTPQSTFRLALWPATSLATLGVLLTAALAGVVAFWALGLGRLEAFLVGAIVASTDAAAVFLLLHQRGTELSRRVSATLELESGLNDPMARPWRRGPILTPSLLIPLVSLLTWRISVPPLFRPTPSTLQPEC